MKTILIMALTIDGKSGRHSNDFPDWTGREDKKMFKSVTMEAGVVIMGSKTFDTIGKPLTGRKNIVLTRDKSRKSNHKNLFFTSKTPETLLNDLKNEGFSKTVLIGGSTINSLFAREKLIDEIYITYCPITFGTGLSLFSMEIGLKVELIEMDRLDKHSIFAKYRVIK